MMLALLIVIFCLGVLAALALPMYLLACGEQRMNRVMSR